MATVTAPIMTDATGQSIDSKLNSLLGKMDNLAAAFQPNASGIVYSNTTSGLTGDDVQEAIDEMAADVSEIKQSLSPSKSEVTTSSTYVNTAYIKNVMKSVSVKVVNLVYASKAITRGSSWLTVATLPSGYEATYNLECNFRSANGSSFNAMVENDEVRIKVNQDIAVNDILAFELTFI